VVKAPLWASISIVDRDALSRQTAAKPPVAHIGEVEEMAEAYLYSMRQTYGTSEVLDAHVTTGVAHTDERTPRFLRSSGRTELALVLPDLRRAQLWHRPAEAFPGLRTQGRFRLWLAGRRRLPPASRVRQ
jgi:hypothetical protein